MTQSIEENVRQLVKDVANRFYAQEIMLATAESCTGGWIAQVVTSIPGSSNWFDSGFVTYSNAAKRRLLAVPGALLAEHGPDDFAAHFLADAGHAWAASLLGNFPKSSPPEGE